MTEKWLELQKEWISCRDQKFNKDKIDKSDISNSNMYDYMSNYTLTPVHIFENQIKFIEFDDNQLILIRNNTYIFDLEHPSNKNHQIVISRHPHTGCITDLSYQGEPGTPGSHVSFYVGAMRPDTLYYYDKYNKGFGGKLIIID